MASHSAWSSRALVHEPRLSSCDEPTSTLDQDTDAKIMAMLRDVANAPNRSVIVVTHDTRSFRYADLPTHQSPAIPGPPFFWHAAVSDRAHRWPGAC